MHVDSGALRDFLISNGLVTRAQLADVLSAGQGEALYDTLAARGVVSQDELRRAAAHVAGVSFVSLSPHDIALETLSLIPEPLSRVHNVVAFRQEGNVVEVAMLDLGSLEHLAFLRDQKGFTVLPRLTTSDSIKQTLRAYQQRLKENFKALLQNSAHAVDALIRHALLSNAGSVHLDLHQTGLLVRYRIQGMLHEAMLLPKEAAHIFERIKEAANLSLTLHVPQEGSFKTELSGGESVSVRVAVSPTLSGDRMTLHLAPERSRRQGFALESLGLHGRALEDAHALLRTRDGLIIVAGPLNAGKTTTLYTLLDILSERGVSVATVEENIEYALPHVAQTQVRSELGLTSAAALRAVLRQDPDIVMLGDVADEQTAALAAQAASRGVLVLMGIEASSAAAAVGKLRDWRIPSSLVASVLKGAIGVQVVQKLCTKEREEYRLARIESAPLEPKANFGRVLAALKEEGIVGKDMQWKELLFARASSCEECAGGYQGKIGLQEVLPVTAPIKDALKEGAGAERVEEIAREDGMLTIAEDGLFKAAQGTTSVEEVVRVVQA
ncbi:MAG TPA: ATPase, T2SS/T4P/T4SS family [Candidatus Paceibacterota bacterium]|nr:ATPase, T2SS/T4P/T4SS family [Candidatus Paceibacterota bacterium]